MPTRRQLLAAIAPLLALGTASVAQDSRPAATMASAAGPRFITVASTTSTVDSGLFNHLLPLFKARTGIDVRVISQGTGQALDTGRRGDADVVFVHARAAEEKFVADGHGGPRRPVMYNDFVLIGPKADPAGLKGSDIVAALGKLAKSAGGKTSFVSRGDKSGTHAAELRYWKAAGVAPKDAGAAYQECGCGMGPALNIAASTGAYVLADRGTWLSFKNRADLAVLVEGDKRLFNQYGVIVTSASRHPHTKTALAWSFAEWIVSPAGQQAIAAYKIGGEQLFFPNASAAP